MQPKRVVITGVGLASPIGNTLPDALGALQSGRHGIHYMRDWERIGDMRTRLGGVVELDLSGRYPRKKIRSMGRVSLLATYATEAAIADARLDPELVSSGRVGLAYGSTTGSSDAMEEFCGTLFTNYSLKGLSANSYLKMMSNTCAANLGHFFQIRGRIITTCSACTSGAQAIGYAYESVKYGLQEVMVAGGAEELHFASAATFDLMFATSAGYNERPDQSPRPFDAARDGLVIGEGAGTVVLESLDRALARGATIHGEILGYGTNCDGAHVTAPDENGMAGAMLLALQSAGLDPSAIDYVNAHGTATEIGDIAESQATRRVFGRAVPISSSKSFTGHTLGACGAIELLYCLGMMQGRFLAPTRNLTQVDPRCADLDYVREPRPAEPRIIMSNNFAFGGVNTSLILGRHDG
ncbi:MAG TPA: beta-ketoacyl-ACP synthase [Nannocystaceae bacterium]|nr:beta-ketoacyl-ACP synthase [Nannocystaceae bacterium]